MAALDLEAEYNNRKRVPAHAEHAARWQAASAAYRQAAKGAELDLAYGPGERNRYDLFRAGDPRRRSSSTSTAATGSAATARTTRSWPRS